MAVTTDLDGTADLVYTGRGALIWMMDIQAWANVVTRLFKPGGSLYVFEGHPITYLFDLTSQQLKKDLNCRGYFYTGTYESTSWPEAYVGKVKDNESDQAKKFERIWRVSEVINALIAAGLVLTGFEEHRDSYWNEFTSLAENDRTSFPNTFSILAQKPK